MENSVFILLVLLICCHLVSAQFPIECRANSSDSLPHGSGVCCPMFNNEVCGGSQRGQCLDVNTTCRIPDVDNYSHWLRPYFSKMCACQGNFYGVACEECWYGYTPSNDGKSCIRSNETRVRRDFLKLSIVERENFFNVLLLMKTTPSNFYIVNSSLSSSLSVYDYLSALHYITMKDEPKDLAHGGPGFPTWHRAYLLLFERLAQKVSGDSTFTLPYVNEYSEADIKTTVDLLGGDGIDENECHVESAVGRNCSCYLSIMSGFSTWQEIGDNGTLCRNISRSLGCSKTAPNPPSKSAFDYAIEQSKYSERPWNISVQTFNNFLEGYAIAPSTKDRTEPSDVNDPRDAHNRLHVYIGGTMYNVQTAASDPIFWLHHAFIDWMLEKWMEKHSDSMIPWTTDEALDGHNYYDCQGPLLPLYGHDKFFLNSVAYGYTYPSTSPSTSSLVVPNLLMTTLVIIAVFLYY